MPPCIRYLLHVDGNCTPSLADPENGRESMFLGDFALLLHPHHKSGSLDGSPAGVLTSPRDMHDAGPLAKGGASMFKQLRVRLGAKARSATKVLGARLTTRDAIKFGAESLRVAATGIERPLEEFLHRDPSLLNSQNRLLNEFLSLFHAAAPPSGIASTSWTAYALLRDFLFPPLRIYRS